jgi:hypothetical protein
LRLAQVATKQMEDLLVVRSEALEELHDVWTRAVLVAACAFQEFVHAAAMLATSAYRAAYLLLRIYSRVSIGY